MTPTCSTCLCWTPHPDDPDRHVCRRRPPAAILAPADGDDGETVLAVWTAWPETEAGDGCWDHVAKSEDA
jgi:hypothetical protein